MQCGQVALLCPFSFDLNPILFTTGTEDVLGGQKMLNTTVRKLSWYTFRKYLLFAFWCAGLLLGIFAACCMRFDLVPLIRNAVGCPASAIGLLTSAVLPFILSAYAVSFPEPWLLLPISALKAFSFGFCAFGVHFAFGSASWLVRLLFLFSDVCVIPLLFFYWLRHIQDTPAKPDREFWCCVLTAVAIGMIDYCLISPFLVRLIEF